jgi:hypothetical protein
MATTIAVTGNLNGRISEAVSAVEKVSAQLGRPVDIWFCLGDMLSAMPGKEDSMLQEILSGKTLLATQTFFVLRDRISGMNEKLLAHSMHSTTPKVRILDPSGVVQLPNGLTIGFFSGIDNSQNKSAVAGRTVLYKNDLAVLNAQQLDILFTFEWPQNVLEHSSAINPSLATIGSPILKELLTTVEAKYIFSIGENCFLEREPFLAPKSQMASRFISLANVGTAQKWLYAFNLSSNQIQPNDSTNSSSNQIQSDDSTPCPFTSIRNDSQIRPPKRVVPLPDVPLRVLSDCWFCLANPTVRKHLIIHVGEFVYVALARGGLSDDHLLIVPIEHVAGDAVPSVPIVAEIATIEEQLCKLFTESGQEAVYFTLKHPSSFHWHKQCIPIPSQCADTVIPFLNSYFTNIGYPLTDKRPDQHLYFEINVLKTLFYAALEIDKFFPAQAAREAMCDFLGLQEFRDWRKSMLSEKAETSLASRWRQRFQHISQ